MAISSVARVVTDRIFGQLAKVCSNFRFATSVVVLSGGAAMGHCVTVAAAPILARLYLPHEIGNLGLFSAFLGVIVVAASLQYDVAIVSAPGQKEAAHLATLSTLFALPMSVAGGLLLDVIIHFSLVGVGVLPKYSAGLIVPTLFFAPFFSLFT